MADTNRFLWTQRQDIGPSARSLHAMAYDGNRKRTVLFGGTVYPRDTASNLSDTWEWDGENWIQVSQFGPPPMAGHAMVYAGTRARVVLFGARDTWEWDGINWTQVADIGPLFSSFAMAYDTQRERIVLFGSRDDVGSTWEWDGIEWTQESESGPGALLNHAMAYDAARRRVVLFGGWTNTRLFRGTWEWDGTKWEQMSAFGPTARIGHAMAFDSERSRVVLFGGGDTQAAGIGGPVTGVRKDTWEWDGHLWLQRQDIGPAGRLFHGLVFDEDRKRMMLFGGTTTDAPPAVTDMGDTWELVESPFPK